MGNELSTSLKDQAWARIRENKSNIDEIIEKLCQGEELTPEEVNIVNMCLMVIRGDLEYVEEEIKEIQKQIDFD